MQTIWDADEPAFLAVYGRRRVGKTHLIRAFFQHRADMYFSVVGQKDASKATQLFHFGQELERVFYDGAPIPRPTSWDQAFRTLCDAIEAALSRDARRRIVIFLDELPWLATRRSGLVQSLEYSWNTRLSRMRRVRLIVCGSAASWMLEKLIHAKGGLHNRITDRIQLRPFSLSEAREYLESRGLRMRPNQVLDLYMAVGGIPHYLKQFRRGRSVAWNLGSICFDREGPLHDEFEHLFTSLFTESGLHERIVRALAKRRSGLLRDELIEATGIPSGGRFRDRLKELEEAGFIALLTPYGRRSKATTYRLIDEFVWFHFRWIEKAPRGVLAEGGADYWLARCQTPSYRSWSGFSFESVCLKHSVQIRHALGITGVAAEVGTWRYVPPPGRKAERGAQIDLLFDRYDEIITLCEIKHASKPWAITKSQAVDLRRKIRVFRERTRTRKDIFLTIIAPHGVKPNRWSRELVHDVVTIDDLFR